MVMIALNFTSAALIFFIIACELLVEKLVPANPSLAYGTDFAGECAQRRTMAASHGASRLVYGRGFTAIDRGSFLVKNLELILVMIKIKPPTFQVIRNLIDIFIIFLTNHRI